MFLWGLSGGAVVFAVAGAFWVGIGAAMTGKQGLWTLSAIATVVELTGAVVLIRFALRLRRRSGFQRSELWRLVGNAKAQQRHLMKWYIGVGIAETVLCGLAATICIRAGAPHLMWPSIGAIVSLHFAPLAKVFHVRTYRATAIAGTLLSLAGFALIRTPEDVAAYGVTMAAVMWGSAAHVLSHADLIADRACSETWAV